MRTLTDEEYLTLVLRLGTPIPLAAIDDLEQIEIRLSFADPILRYKITNRLFSYKNTFYYLDGVDFINLRGEAGINAAISVAPFFNDNIPPDAKNF